MIKQKHRIWLVAAVLAVGLASGLAVAATAQEAPASYYGEVDINVDPADENVELIAVVDGEDADSIAVESDGSYGGPSPDDGKLRIQENGASSGDDVTFEVDGDNFDRTAVDDTDPDTVTVQFGEIQEVDVEVSVDVDDDDDDDDDTGGTGGQAPATEPDDDDDVDVDPDDEPDIEDVREEVEQSEPDVDEDREIVDGSVDVSDVANSVERIDFADEATVGSVRVREYSAENVVESTSQSLSAQLNQDVRSVGSVADITVADEAGEPAADTAATVTMGIDADEVNNPDNVVINHETDDGWEQLDTTLEEVTDDRVRVSGDVDGFSLFAVAELEPDAEEEVDDDEPVDEEDPDDGIGTTGLIGLVVVIALLIAAAVAYRQMNDGGDNNSL